MANVNRGPCCIQVSAILSYARHLRPLAGSPLLSQTSLVKSTPEQNLAAAIDRPSSGKQSCAVLKLGISHVGLPAGSLLD